MIRSRKSYSDQAPAGGPFREESGDHPWAITVTGNGRIGGGSGTDQLTGGSGPDTLIGHGGADTLTGNDGDDVLIGDGVQVRSATLANVHDYAIIYQGSSYAENTLKTSNHDLLIINPARLIFTDTHSETLWLRSQVLNIESGGKVVLGYLNVAKVNDYTAEWRTSWTSNGNASGTNVPGQAPDFLRQDGAEPNTRLVDFWHDGWKTVLHERIITLIEQGFNGLFLDDVLEYYFRRGNTLAGIQQAAQEMRDLVIDLSAFAHNEVRMRYGDAAANAFVIVENGGPELITHTTANGAAANPAAAAAFYASIDGFLAEGYFSGGDNRAIDITIANYGTRGIALFSADRNVSGATATAIRTDADVAGFVPTTVPNDIYDTNPTHFTSTVGDNAPGNDILNGGAGNDVLVGGGGNDMLNGGADNDSLNGNAGNDTMDGGAGNDVFSVDSGDTIVEGAGGGFDQVYSATSFVLSAGAEVEVLAAADSAATLAIALTGNAFGQQIIGNAGNNGLAGGGGADALYGRGGDDIYTIDTDDVIVEAAGEGFDQAYSSTSFTLTAGAAVEVLSVDNYAATTAINLTGNAFGQQIFGNAGANSLAGGGGADALYGAGGNDIYSVDADDVVVDGVGLGFDQVYSSTGFTLTAGAQIEVLSVGDYAAVSAINLTGNEFGQQVYGNAGANVLNGGGGADMLIGNAGADTFAFTAALGGSNIDLISDFAAGVDKIALDDAAFSGLSPGGLPAAAFVIGNAAQDMSDRIIYNSATGQLLFDADGTGAIAAVQFATLSTGLGLVAGDFVVI